MDGLCIQITFSQRMEIEPSSDSIHSEKRNMSNIDEWFRKVRLKSGV